MIDYANILSAFYSDKRWRIDNCYDYETLIWLDEGSKPLKTELDSRWEEVLHLQKRTNCKAQARQLLADSDWSETPSVIEQLENADEWKTYRMEIRRFVITPVEHPLFPNKPQTKWKV